MALTCPRTGVHQGLTLAGTPSPLTLTTYSLLGWFRVGTIAVADGRGAWKGTAAIGPGTVHLGMVTADGTKVCAARLT